MKINKKPSLLLILCKSNYDNLIETKPWNGLNEFFLTNIHIFKLPRDGSDFKKIFPAFLQTLNIIFKINNYDFVITTSTVGGLTIAFLQSILGKKFIKPKHLMIDVATIRFFNKSGKLLCKMVNFIFSSVEIILCYARNTVTFWKEKIKFNNDCIFIPLMVDTELYFSGKNDKDYIISVGRVGRDFDILINLAKEIKTKIIIIGSKKDYLLLKPEIDKVKNIEYLVEINKEKYIELVQGARFVVLPFKKINFDCGQTVLTQSMSMGKAVIVTRFVGTEDYVINNEDGIFVEAQDYSMLKEKTNYLLQNPSEIKRLGLNARKKAVKLFDQQVVIKKIADIMLNLQ